MKRLVAIVLLLAGCAFAGYVAVAVFLAGAIGNIGYGFRANPIDKWQVLWGFVEIPLAFGAIAVIALLSKVLSGMGSVNISVSLRRNNFWLEKRKDLPINQQWDRIRQHTRKD